MDANDARFVVGDSVRLSRDVDGVPVGTVGRVLGFLRREPELVVISVGGGRVLRVRPDDVTKELHTPSSEPEPD